VVTIREKVMANPMRRIARIVRLFPLGGGLFQGLAQFLI
jgi:hypothetical protein